MIAADLRRGDAVRFRPEARANRVVVLVDSVTSVGDLPGSLMFIHGVRLNADGCQDSQARRHAWPVRPWEPVEIVEE